MPIQTALTRFVELHDIVEQFIDASEAKHEAIVLCKDQSENQLETFAIQKMMDRSGEMVKIFRNYLERIKEDARQIDPTLFVVAPVQNEVEE